MGRGFAGAALAFGRVGAAASLLRGLFGRPVRGVDLDRAGADFVQDSDGFGGIAEASGGLAAGGGEGDRFAAAGFGGDDELTALGGYADGAEAAGLEGGAELVEGHRLHGETCGVVRRCLLDAKAGWEKAGVLVTSWPAGHDRGRLRDRQEFSTSTTNI